MLWVTLISAILCAVLFPMPVEFAIPIMMLASVAFPAVLTTVIIYGGSYQRTFCIGAIFPSGIFLLTVPYGAMSMFRMGFPGGDDFGFRLMIFAYWVFCGLVGANWVGGRRAVEKRPASQPNGESIRPAARAVIENPDEREFGGGPL